MSEKEKDYIRLYEEEKSRREKIEKDYCLLNEKMKDINKKTEEMVKNIQEREALIKNYESQHKNDIEKYEKKCKECEEIKLEAIKISKEKDIYINGISKLIYTLGK